MKAILLLIIWVEASLAQPLEITVTPEGIAKGFSCKVGTETIPAQIQEGRLRLKVEFNGVKGTIHWRLPLYQALIGDTGVAAAQIGEADPHGNKFFHIEIPATELTYVNGPIELQLTAPNGKQTKCKTRLHFAQDI